jgi:CxxC-x17-CxxC domain-containing protein
MYQDKNITCRDCGEDFVFTAGEQEFYAAKGFDNEPTRCKSCRDTRKAGRPKGGGSYDARPRRQMFSVVCDDCGNETEVPFQPSQDRPVYCKECFNRRKT